MGSHQKSNKKIKKSIDQEEESQYTNYCSLRGTSASAKVEGQENSIKSS